jgi:hypothetical protein
MATDAQPARTRRQSVGGTDTKSAGHWYRQNASVANDVVRN